MDVIVMLFVQNMHFAYSFCVIVCGYTTTEVGVAT